MRVSAGLHRATQRRRTRAALMAGSEHQQQSVSPERKWGRMVCGGVRPAGFDPGPTWAERGGVFPEPRQARDEFRSSGSLRQADAVACMDRGPLGANSRVLRGNQDVSGSPDGNAFAPSRDRGVSVTAALVKSRIVTIYSWGVLIGRTPLMLGLVRQRQSTAIWRPIIHWSKSYLP